MSFATKMDKTKVMGVGMSYSHVGVAKPGKMLPLELKETCALFAAMEAKVDMVAPPCTRLQETVRVAVAATGVFTAHCENVAIPLTRTASVVPDKLAVLMGMPADEMAAMESAQSVPSPPAAAASSAAAASAASISSAQSLGAA